jgi:hypothetical protein
MPNFYVKEEWLIFSSKNKINMKLSVVPVIRYCCILSVLLLLSNSALAEETSKSLIGRLQSNARVYLIQSNKAWGILVETDGQSSFSQPAPIQFEFYKDLSNIEYRSIGYKEINKKVNGFIGKGSIQHGSAELEVVDDWIIAKNELQLSRTVICKGSDSSGVMSSITLSSNKAPTKDQLNYFVPGIRYGSSKNITEAAIGGSRYQNYIRIREDRLPAPMFGIHFPDQSSITVLDLKPNGKTSAEDALSTNAMLLIDRSIQVGAIGIDHVDGRVQMGFWYPGTEGEITYLGNTYPGGQLHSWRRRYHPLENGMKQQYNVAFRFSKKEDFISYYYQSWLWAWSRLNPALVPHNIKTVREALIEQLSSEVFQYPQGWGISNWMMATSAPYQRDNKCILGFTGKAIESAELLLLNSFLYPTQSRADSNRIKAIGLIDNFIKRVSISPAKAEGFDLNTGELTQALFVQKVDEVFLRSYTDDLKALLRAYKIEKRRGVDHRHWIAYAQSFADWLLPQQNAEGGFPRTWEFKTGKLKDASPQASYNAIPFLVLLAEVTKDKRYLDGALRAGRFVLKQQRKGNFVGGTIDNPDIIDKEAGTLSLEAYLALYETTKDRQWLAAAERAAQFAETWIFLWNIPMSEAVKDSELHWKHNVPTTGAQLIATGHSLTDNYMSFDVDEYAHLYKLTGNKHYKNVAKLLLHNTKSMIALPNRLYDLRGIGWSQEHFTFAPPRGLGLHRGWLPWVSTSHLNGILMLEMLDKNLYKELTDLNSIK